MSTLDDLYGTTKNENLLDSLYGTRSTDSLLDSLYGTGKPSSKASIARDTYGNTEKAIASEKARIAQTMALADTTQTPIDLGNGTIAIPDEGKPTEAKPGGTYVGEISDEYASKHRVERLQKQNILQEQALGEISRTQYKNERNDRLRSKPTSMLERLANDIDDGYDDVVDYIFGKTKYKNKAEEEEAARADMNLEIDEDGNAMYSRQSTMNDKSLDSLTGELMGLEDDPEADQMIYYGRVDNPDGTHSYKIGLAGVDPYGRTKDEDRGKDITYLWAKRTKDAAKYESLFHGNKTLLRDRRNDIGTDVEGYGAGKSEIYNIDFLRLDGGVSLDKIKTLNRSSQAKLQELGINVAGRYDTKGMEVGYKALDKTRRLYGDSSKEAKELEYLMANMEHTGKKTRALVGVPGDLFSAALSSSQQVVAGLGDMVLDASATIVNVGQGELLDNLKSAEQADKTWGYKGRKEVEALGREAVRSFKDGDYVGALIKGIQAAPDTVAQSLPDMALMFSGVGTAAKAASVATELAAKKIVAKEIMKASNKGINVSKQALMELKRTAPKTAIAKQAGIDAAKAWEKRSKASKLLDPRQNKGLALFAAKQTNNQIDERLANGEDSTNLAQVGAMFASNYVLGGIDKWSFGKQFDMEPIKAMLKSMPKKGIEGAAVKAAGIAASLVKAGSLEAAQEFVQSYGEVLNGGLGTEKYGNDPFNDHFLDEATKGALLGFGAGGLMHGGVIGTQAITGGLSESKRKQKVKENKPFTESEGPLSDLSPFNNEEEIAEATEDVPKSEALVSLDEFIFHGIDEDTSELLHKTLNAYKKNNKITEKEYNEYKAKVEDARSPYVKQLKTILNPSTKPVNKNVDQARLITFLSNAGENLNEVVAVLKTEIATGRIDKVQLEEYFNELSLLQMETGNIAAAKQNIQVIGERLNIQESKSPTPMDVAVKDNLEGTSNLDNAFDQTVDPEHIDDYESIGDVLKTIKADGKADMESYIQTLIMVANKAKGKSSRLGNKDTTVDEVLAFLSNLDQSEIDNEGNALEDIITGQKHSRTIKRVAKAFARMSDKSKETFLKTQQNLLDTVLNMRSGAERAKASMGNTKKTPEEVTFDIIVGDGSYGKRSLQEYMRDGLKAMSIDDEATRNKALSNIIENMEFWIGVQGTQAETQALNETIKEEHALKHQVLKTLNTLRHGDAATVPSIKALIESHKKKHTKIPVEDTTSSELPKGTHTKDRGYDIVELEDGSFIIFKDGKETAKTTAKTLATVKGVITKRINAKAKLEGKKPGPKKKNLTMQEVIVEGVGKGIIGNSAIAEALVELINNINEITFTEKLNDSLFNPLGRGVDNLLGQAPFSSAKITEEVEKQDSHTKDMDLEYTDKVSNFIGRFEDVIRNIYKKGFELTPAFVKYTPELAYLTRMEGSVDSTNGKSLPPEVATAMLRAAVKIIADKTSALSGDTVYDPKIGEHLLSIKGLNEEDIENLHGLGMPQNTLVEQIANVLKEDIQVDGEVGTESLFVPNSETKVDVEIDHGKAFRDNLALELAGVMVLEMVKSGILEQNMFERTSVSRGSKVTQVQFIRFKQEEEGKQNFEMINEGNAASRLSNYIASIFGKPAEKKGFYVLEEDMEDLVTKLPNGQPISEVSSETLATIRDDMTFELNDGIKTLLDLKPNQMLALFNINEKDVPPVSLMEMGYSMEEIRNIYSGEKTMYELTKRYDGYLERTKALNSIGVLQFKGKILQKVDVIKTLQAIKPIADEAIKMDAFVGGNGRIYIKTFGTASVQGDKLLRHILQTSNMKKIVNIDTGSKAFGFWKNDMVQALQGFLPDSFDFAGEDKSTPTRSLDAFDELERMFSSKSNKDLMGVIGKMVNKEVLEDTDVTLLSSTIDFSDGHAVSGLIDMYAYLEARNEKVGAKRAKKGYKRSFDSKVSAESDAATSGVAFKAMQNGTLKDAARFMLMTGIITKTGLKQLLELDGVKNTKDKQTVINRMLDGTDIASLQVLNESGITIKDAYQQTVINFLEGLGKENKALLNSLEALFGKLVEQDSNGNIIKVTPNGRDFAKQPQMQFLYGQQEGSLSEYIGSLASDNLTEALMSTMKSKAQKSENIGKLLKSLNEAIKAEIGERLDEDSEYVTLLNDKLLSEEEIAEYVFLAAHDKDQATEALEHIKAVVSTLVGGGLYNALEDTFSPLNPSVDPKNPELTQDKLVIEAYNAVFVMSESIRLATDLANDIKSPSGMPKEYLNKVNEALREFEFILGNSEGQELAINKRGTDSSVYESGMADNTLLEGGNQLRIKYDGRSMSVRKTSPSRKSAAQSLLPLDTHNKDANVIKTPVNALKVTQVYDALIANGVTRVAAEILANLEFYRQTLTEDHIVDASLAAIERIEKVFGKDSTLPKEIDDNLSVAIKTVSTANNLQKELGSLSAIQDRLDKAKKLLLEAKKSVDTNKAAKKADMLALAQYGINGKPFYDHVTGELLGFAYSSNGVEFRVTEMMYKEYDGKVHAIKDMPIGNTMEAIADYFDANNFDDKMSDKEAYTSDTQAISEEVVSIFRSKIEAKAKKEQIKQEAKKADEDAAAADLKEREEAYAKKKLEENNSNRAPTLEEEATNAEEMVWQRIIREDQINNMPIDPVKYEDFESLGENDINEILTEAESETVSEINESSIASLFNKMLRMSSKQGEKSFLKTTMQDLILPILDANEQLVIDLIERKGIDMTGAHGRARVKYDKQLDSIVIIHPSRFDGSSQSSTEVFVHELVHIYSKYLFSSSRVSNSWVKERGYIQDLFNQVDSMITEDNYTDWFGDGLTAEEQYRHIFYQKDSNRALAEFVSYALSNKLFGTKMNKEIDSVDTSLLDEDIGITVPIIDKLIKKIVGMLNKLFRRKDGSATDMIKNILLETHGVETKKKNMLVKAVENVTHNLRTLDYKLKYYSYGAADRLNIIDRAAGIINVSREHLPRIANNISDRGSISILMSDLLPSHIDTVPYVEHAIEARTKIDNERDIIQKKIMGKILKLEDGNPRIDHSQDELLKEIVLDLDLQALYNIEGISLEDIFDLFKDKDSNVEDTLIKEISDMYNFSSAEMIAFNEDVNNLADGLLIRKNKEDAYKPYRYVNADQIAKIHAFRKTHKASSQGVNRLALLTDALASLRAIDKQSNHKKRNQLETLEDIEEIAKDVIKVAHSITIKTRRESPKENAFRIKGKFTSVKDTDGYIIPIIETADTKALSTDYKEIDSYELAKGVTVTFYKVTRSILQNTTKGAVGTIEAGDNAGVSILDAFKHPNVKAIVNGINKATDIPGKEEMFIFEHNSDGTVKDIKLRVPEIMERDNLSIDNRASVTLAHSEGRLAEAKASHSYNDKWLELAGKDFLGNYSSNPKDFVWIGNSSKEKDLKRHYTVMTDRMKKAIRKSPMASGSHEGMWVRKTVLRLNFGGEGKSIIDMLQTYGVDNKGINKVIRMVEEGLVDIGKIFKLEIVGKTYDVIAGNIISNILLETIKGRNPVEVARVMFEGMVEIDRLNQNRKKLANINLEAEAAIDADTQARLLRKASRVQNEIDKSPVKYLDDAGFNSSFVEDVTTSEGVYKSDKEKRLYSYLSGNKSLRGLKKGFDFVYMHKGTTLGEAFTRVVIASDAGSRYATDVLDTKYLEEDIKVEYKVFTDKKDGYEGYSRRDKALLFKDFRNRKVREFEKTRKKDLLEQHIDYALKAGDVMTALDKLAITPFFKFKQRIAKVLYKRYSNNPASALVIGSFLAYVDGVNSLSGYDFERAEESFFDILSKTSGSPIDHILEVLTPALFDNLGFTDAV